MKTCHVCGQPWLDHAPGCRVLSDLERMRKVFDRLVDEQRDPDLRGRIGQYLRDFGSLPCQQADGPRGSLCPTCGHDQVCVIKPEV